MSLEFLNQLPCADRCSFGRECGTRLILETRVCKDGVKMASSQKKSEFPNLAFDFKTRTPDTIVVVSTDNVEHAPMWIIRAQPWREWREQAVYVRGVFQKLN